MSEMALVLTEPPKTTCPEFLIQTHQAGSLNENFGILKNDQYKDMLENKFCSNIAPGPSARTGPPHFTMKTTMGNFPKNYFRL